jgi:hypothetical protein
LKRQNSTVNRNSESFVPASSVELLRESNALPDWFFTEEPDGDLDKLASVAFADTHGRRLPLHSKRATFVSALEAYLGDFTPGAWEVRLKTACHAYDITEDVKRAIRVLRPVEEEPEKQASAETDTRFALVLQVAPDEPPAGFYPLHTPAFVEHSVEKLAKDLREQRLPESWLQQAAVKLVKAAGDFGINALRLPAVVRELGEERLPSVEYLRVQAERRAEDFGPEAGEFYKSAAESALGGAVAVEDAAHLWELADRKLGVSYGERFARPVAAFSSGVRKSDIAKRAASLVELAEVTVPFVAIQTLPDTSLLRFDKKAAASISAAKTAKDGLQATQHLNLLEADEQLELLRLLAV